MPKISSDLTNQTFTSSAPMSTFEIPDESQGAAKPSQMDFESLDALRQARGLPALDDKMKRAMFAGAQQEEQSHTHEASSVHNLREFEKKIDDARKMKQNGTVRLSPAAKARIEALCEMSRGTRSVEIDGNSYVLQTIKGKEHRAAIVAAADFDGTPHAAFEVRKQLLARAITKIGGYDIGLFLGDSSMEARLEFIDELDEAVLIKLYSEYLDVAQTTQNKYFVKTEADVKEVMEDLKK